LVGWLGRERGEGEKVEEDGVSFGLI